MARAPKTPAKGKAKQPEVLSPLKDNPAAKRGKASGQVAGEKTAKPLKEKAKVRTSARTKAAATKTKPLPKPRKPRAAKKAAVEREVDKAPKRLKFEKRFVVIARRMFLAKVTDEDIAATIGIDVEELEWWKEEHPEFGACFRPDPKNYGGRPTNWDERNITIAKTLAELGATDLEIAQAFEVSIRTIHRWKLEYPDFREALEIGKDAADRKVEDSLYKRATGYSFDSEKIVVVEGEPQRVEIIEHVPPDVKAATTWLFNRQPEKWRSVQHIKHDVPKDSPIASFLSGLGARTFAPREQAAETRDDRQRPNQIMPKDGQDG